MTLEIELLNPKTCIHTQVCTHRRHGIIKETRHTGMCVCVLPSPDARKGQHCFLYCSSTWQTTLTCRVWWHINKTLRLDNPICTWLGDAQWRILTVIAAVEIQQIYFLSFFCFLYTSTDKLFLVKHNLAEPFTFFFAIAKTQKLAQLLPQYLLIKYAKP